MTISHPQNNPVENTGQIQVGSPSRKPVPSRNAIRSAVLAALLSMGLVAFPNDADAACGNTRSFGSAELSDEMRVEEANDVEKTAAQKIGAQHEVNIEISRLIGPTYRCFNPNPATYYQVTVDNNPPTKITIGGSDQSYPLESFQELLREALLAEGLIPNVAEIKLDQGAKKLLKQMGVDLETEGMMNRNGYYSVITFTIGGKSMYARTNSKAVHVSTNEDNTHILITLIDWDETKQIMVCAQAANNNKTECSTPIESQ